MKKGSKYLSIFIFISNYIYSQPGTKIWDKRFGGTNSEYFKCMINTHDGGFLLGGSSWSHANGDKSQRNLGYSDFWVIKINSNGDKVWDKTFGGNGGETIKFILTTNDGGYLLGGNSSSGANGDKSQVSQGNDDFWVVKIDFNGNKSWDKTFGGNLDDDLICILATNDNGFLLCGESFSGQSGDKTQDTQGGYDYWVVRIDEYGNKNWDKRFGGTSTDRLTCAIKMNNGGYILGGYSYSGQNGDKTQQSQGSDDYWVVRIDENGNKNWDKRFGGSGSDTALQLTTTSDGFYLIGGASGSSANGDKSQSSWGSSDFWIVKIDENGNKIWDKRYGGTNSDFFSSLINTVDGGFLLGGFSDSENNGDKSQSSRGVYDYWIIKLDINGYKLWDRRYGGSGYEYYPSILPTTDSNFLVGGYTLSGANGDKSQNSYGEEDFWVIKVSGKCSLSLNLESPNDDIVNGVEIKEDTNSLTGTIIAKNKITGTSNVIYRAGTSIVLNPGFSSENGTIFKTEINGCSN